MAACSCRCVVARSLCTPRCSDLTTVSVALRCHPCISCPRVQLLAVKRHYVAAIATIGSSLPQGGATASPLYYAPIPSVSAPLSVLALYGSNDTLCPPAGGVHSALLPDDPTGVLLSADASAHKIEGMVPWSCLLANPPARLL